MGTISMYRCHLTSKGIFVSKTVSPMSNFHNENSYRRRDSLNIATGGPGHYEVWWSCKHIPTGEEVSKAIICYKLLCWIYFMEYKGALTLHPRSLSEHPSLSSDVIKTSELMFVFTLIRVRVRDFCLGHPCPSSLLHVAISSDADVRVCPMLSNVHAQSHLGFNHNGISYTGKTSSFYWIETQDISSHDIDLVLPLNFFLMEDKELFIPYYGCWWPRDIRTQGISSHGIDLV